MMNGYKIISGEQWCLHAFDVVSSSGIGGDGPQSTFWQDGGAVGMLFRSEVCRVHRLVNEFELGGFYVLIYSMQRRCWIFHF